MVPFPVPMEKGLVPKQQKSVCIVSGRKIARKGSDVCAAGSKAPAVKDEIA